jgi:hypothetical protein
MTYNMNIPVACCGQWRDHGRDNGRKKREWRQPFRRFQLPEINYSDRERFLDHLLT